MEGFGVWVALRWGVVWVGGLEGGGGGAAGHAAGHFKLQAKGSPACTKQARHKV